MKIRITKKDILEAELMAKDTVFILEKLGILPRLNNVKQTRLDANILGFMAEFAVCRLFETDPPRLNFATDGGVDLWIEDISIDVKFTNHRKNGLIFDSFDKFKSRIAILVTNTPEFDVMEIIGWCSKNDFMQKSYEKDFGYGVRKVLDLERLKSIENFWYEFNRVKFE